MTGWSLKPLSTGCTLMHFLPRFTFLHRFAFIQHYFTRLILFGHSCVFVVCVHFRVGASEAMLGCLCGLRVFTSELNENPKKEWKGAPQSVSLHQTWRLLLFHITRSYFYSHTSQPLSSHLHSPACKLHCSLFYQRRSSATACFQLALAFQI